MTFSTVTIGIADPEDTGLLCHRCDTPVSKKKWLRVGPFAWRDGICCQTCKADKKTDENYFDPSTAHLEVTADTAHLLDDAEASTAAWFHATKDPNWMDSLNKSASVSAGSVIVHVGVKEAALARIKDVLWMARLGGPQEYFLYEVRLRGSAQLLSEVVDDENEWPSRSNAFENRYGAGDAIRYVNRWETPGSVSLLVDAAAIEVVKVSKRRFAKRASRN